MSRCFGFPPPGYEKKVVEEEENLSIIQSQLQSQSQFQSQFQSQPVIKVEFDFLMLPPTIYLVTWNKFARADLVFHEERNVYQYVMPLWMFEKKPRIFLDVRSIFGSPPNKGFSKEWVLCYLCSCALFALNCSDIDGYSCIVKLQSERDKAKEEKRKEKKRQKKEKKKEKKEKSRADGELDKKKHSHEKKRHEDKGSSGDHKWEDNPKKRKHDPEHLEKSSLTEEHDQPASIVNLCDSSSDSTQNSSKRRKQNMPPSSGCHNQSTTPTTTVLRIRLPLQKQKASPTETPAASNDQLFSTSARDKKIEVALTTRSREQSFSAVIPQASKGQIYSTSGRDKQIELVSVPSLIKKQSFSAVIPQASKGQIYSTSGRDKQIELASVPSLIKKQSFSAVIPQASKGQIYSTSGRDKKIELASVPSLIKKQSSSTVIPQASKEQLCSTSGRDKMLEVASTSYSKEQPSSARTEIPEALTRESFFRSVRSRDIDSRLRDLIDNWVPSSIDAESADFDDQEWLFDVKPRHEEANKAKACDVVQPLGNSGFWMQPRACYLPEADIYALPYTIPY
ncbi:hypothetical protein GIB67_040831 [Kingdonia uniflora]|uniref:Uncharacterized protein n=1 Tax=Kingdonia uniflora TaxID=39325 RepID=A0A7J7P583_9MAGN|nr:hypothetical protein GIB67_040831 [Kingdonia uniflora]